MREEKIESVGELWQTDDLLRLTIIDGSNISIPDLYANKRSGYGVTDGLSRVRVCGKHRILGSRNVIRVLETFF